MKRLAIIVTMAIFLVGCSSNVRFISTDSTYICKAKPKNASVVFRRDRITRPHRVIGVIEAKLGRKARRPELDTLLMIKARAIGADGVMLVDYDIERNVYLEKHHAVVGRGPWRKHVVGTRRRVVTEKTATGIAVVFP